MSTCKAVAKPSADEKLAGRIMKLVEKSQEQKILARGVKEVSKTVVADKAAVVILAADTAPVDVLSHLPVLCERHNCKYIWIESRSELGKAAGLPRSTGVVCVKKDAEANRVTEELFAKVVKKVPVIKSE